MATKLAATLIKSVIGSTQDQRATVRSLGLRRLHQTVDLQDTPSVRGALHKIRHLVKVDES